MPSSSSNSVFSPLFFPIAALGDAMASCSCIPHVHFSTSQATLLTSRTLHSTSSSLPLSSLRLTSPRRIPLRVRNLGFSASSQPRGFRIRCSSASGASATPGEGSVPESPYLTLGVSALEKFEVIKAAYTRRRKDAEKRGDEGTVERLEKAYDKIMMMQLSNRKQGLAFGGQFAVSKEIKYADKRSWFPWGPKKAPVEKREVWINLAISVLFSAWIAAGGGQAEWKPLQFMIFIYIYRLFNKLKEFEPAAVTVSYEDEEEGEGGGRREDSGTRLKNGKRLLRTLGLVFSCVAVASLTYTGILNAFELAGQYIPRALMGAQELFVTGVTAAGLFIIASYFR